MSDYTVVWAGHMGCITDGEGWRQKESPLKYAPSPGDFFTGQEQQHIASKMPERSPWRQARVGRPATAGKVVSRVCACGRKKPVTGLKCNGCYMGKKARVTSRARSKAA